LGGLLGATAASVSKKSAGGASGIRAYWTCLTGLTILAGLAFAFFVTSSRDSGGILSLLIALMFLPFVQLAASIVALLWIQFRSADFPEKANLQVVGRITLWSILGAVAGLVMMVLAFKMFH
jgi:glucan phosphoethanolaminetransferase (alkaline phosphatase superfamily)